jgi:hypothetical protein
LFLLPLPFPLTEQPVYGCAHVAGRHHASWLVRALTVHANDWLDQADPTSFVSTLRSSTFPGSTAPMQAHNVHLRPTPAAHHARGVQHLGVPAPRVDLVLVWPRHAIVARNH